MNLVIVESPSKTKKIEKFLGKDYKVLSSVGHIRDLPKSKLSVDVDNKYQPDYVIADNKKSVVNDLKKVAKESDVVYLATDPDREGEAIAWHVGIVLNGGKELVAGDKNSDVLVGLKNKNGSNPKLYRVAFNSITKDAVLEAFRNPRGLDFDLINAQQARRILDRLVGYRLSPLLWKKIRYGLSAGRVQSVAVRFVVERERERNNFNASAFYEVNATFGVNKENIPTSLHKIDGKSIKDKVKFDLFAGEYFATKTSIDTKDKLETILNETKGLEYKISDIEEKDIKTSPYPPFMTSSLQQAASTNLGMSPKRTMQLAQKLYENGYITYMRTDSYHIVPEELDKIRSFIKKNYGYKYLSTQIRVYKDTKGKKTQEAHEAIRPTDIALSGNDLPKSITDEQKKIYDLIRNRTMACQMSSAVYTSTKINISNLANDSIKDSKYQFTAQGSVVKFDGYTRIYKSKKQDVILPSIDKKNPVNLVSIEDVEKAMSLPPRYNESSLVKELENNNIGRPSTYATIVSTIQSRGYVSKSDKQLVPTDNGYVVNDLLVNHFKQIVDVGFTSDLEDGLDEVALGQINWVDLIDDFYKPFNKLIEQKDKEIKKEDIVILDKTDEKCPECGLGKLVTRLGRYGKFLSCDRYPDCKYARPIELQSASEDESEIIPELENEKCPECNGELTVKAGRFGKFIACKNYPKCKYTRPILNKINMKCPLCGEKEDGEVVMKKTKRGRMFFGCSRYPSCEYSSWTNPSKETEDKENN